MEAARPATGADADALASLKGRAARELSGLRGGPMWLRRRAATATSSMRDPHDRLTLVGTVSDVVVGFAEVHRLALGEGGSIAVLEALYVEPEAREVGVGEALMEAVLRWAKDAGCEGIDAEVLPGSRAAKNFFERFGLVARSLVVHRPLSP